MADVANWQPGGHAAMAGTGVAVLTLSTVFSSAASPANRQGMITQKLPDGLSVVRPSRQSGAGSGRSPEHQPDTAG